MVLAAAERHHVDALLLVAVDAYECDLGDRDAPVYKVVRGRKRLVGYDACPMGMRVLDVGRRRRLGPAELYEMAALDLERSTRVFRALGYSPRRALARAVARRNSGNPAYGTQVFAIVAALGGRRVEAEGLSLRTREIVRRLVQIFKRST